MTRRSLRRFWPIAALIAVLALAIPTVGTLAQLTAQKSATATVTAGDWCAMPDAAAKKNVYKLSDFTDVSAPEKTGGSTATHMLVLPVANDGSFAPVTPLSSTVGATQNQLGVRLWSCANLTASAGNLKVTAWRGDYASNAFSWTTAPTLGSFASARLAATSTKALDAATTAATDPGSELRDLHRSQDLLGGVVDGTDPVTGRYSWLLSTGRSKTATTADPACAAAACSLTPGAGITGFANVFSSDMSAAASGGVSGNSVTYLAKKYYEYGTRTVKVCQERSGIWPFFGDWTDTDACGTNGLFKQYRQVDREFTGSAVPVPASGKPAAQATTLSPAAGASVDGLLRDKTGTKLQWVVLEWWGSQAPTDLEIEVFVAP